MAYCPYCRSEYDGDNESQPCCPSCGYGIGEGDVEYDSEESYEGINQKHYYQSYDEDNSYEYSDYLDQKKSYDFDPYENYNERKRNNTANFSPQQKDIIKLRDGNHIVVAPPGTGKTTLLAERLINTLKENVVDPRRMICLTFTNRAARNMKSKVENLLQANNIKHDDIFIGNFHSFGIKFLSKNKLIPRGISILDEMESKLIAGDTVRLISEIDDSSQHNKIEVMQNLMIQGQKIISLYDTSLFGLLSKINISFIQHEALYAGLTIALKHILSMSDILKKISQVLPNETIYYPLAQMLSNLSKNGCTTLKEDELIASFDPSFYLQKNKNNYNKPFVNLDSELNDRGKVSVLLSILFAHEYGKTKNEILALDYNDILNITLFHLINTKNLLYNNYSWIQVDEAQDLNATQWSILDKLTANDHHSVIFGDIGQSIFSFIGGDYEALNKKTMNYELHDLTINYRSPAQLLDIFNHYSANVLKNLPIPTVIPNPGRIEDNDNKPILMSFIDNSQESQYICERVIPKLMAQSKNDSNIAILTRTNKQAQNFSYCLNKNKIRHFKVSSFDIFDYANTMDFMSFLTILHNPQSKLSWIRILSIFSNISLIESREIINALFRVGFNPSFLLLDDQVDIENNPFQKLRNLYNLDSFIIFDVETTGLDVFSDDIIQIGALKVVKGKIVDEKEWYIKIKHTIPMQITEITGITNEKLLQNGRFPEEVFSEFLEFIEDNALVAHNISFDWAILNNNLKRYLNKILLSNRPKYDTYYMAVNLYPYLPEHKLGFLIEYFQFEGFNFHNAIEDVRATFLLLKKMLSDYSSSFENSHKIFKENETLFQKFHKNFKPLWDEVHSKTENISFKYLFFSFFNYIDKNLNYYSLTYCADIEEKLIRHMEYNCPSDTLKNLLKNYLKMYIEFNESDLIIEEKDKLIVSTIHRAKGLQFNIVLIPFCTGSNFPVYTRPNHTEKSKAEEARILYVGMSRALNQLIITEHYQKCITTRSDRLLIVYGGLTPFLQKTHRFFKKYELYYCPICKLWSRNIDTCQYCSDTPTLCNQWGKYNGECNFYETCNLGLYTF